MINDKYSTYESPFIILQVSDFDYNYLTCNESKFLTKRFEILTTIIIGFFTNSNQYIVQTTSEYLITYQIFLKSFDSFKESTICIFNTQVQFYRNER